MRLAVLSDLHLDSGPYHPPPLDADLVIVAGDVANGSRGVAWVRHAFPDLPTVYVPGNREHWHHSAGEPVANLRGACAGSPVHLLHDGEARFADGAGRDVIVLGTTLWTDFVLEGSPAAAMAAAGARMPDYRGIRVHGQPLTPGAVLARHRAARVWLAAALARPRDGAAVVVVSHHAPSIRSFPRRRPGHLGQITAVSQCEPLIEAHGPDLWVHGHTHHDCDYRIGRTRVISRQRGSAANRAFAPLMIEL